MSAPRSYLFVPGDSARKIDKAASSGADAIIIDLEDSVAPAHKANALQTTRDFLAERPALSAPEIWVRINTERADQALAELASLPLAGLRGIFYPKLADVRALERVGHWLDALETRDGVATGQVRIVGIVTETPRALVATQAGSLADGHLRLRGYSWGVEDLSSALGRAPLAGASDAQQALSHAAQMHCLLLAAAAGVDAIDGVSTAFKDLSPLVSECERASELGFVAKMAIHPAQLATIHAGLAPSAAAVDWAERVCALVREQPEAAALSLDGRMVDQPHINVARRILARAGSAES